MANNPVQRDDAGGDASILVVGDEASIVTPLVRAMGLVPLTVRSAAEALQEFESAAPSLVVVDRGIVDVPLRLLIRELHAAAPRLPIVVSVRDDDAAGAAELLDAGARETINPAWPPERLRDVLGRLLDEARRHQPGEVDPERRRFFRTFASAFHRGTKSRDLFQSVLRVAESEAPVLVRGEAGTGKKLVARALHYLSPRSSAPLVRLACTAVPPEALDSELFGTVTTDGKLEQAAGGSLVIESFTELPLSTQGKLARVVQEGTAYRVADRTGKPIDVRIIATTSAEVERLVGLGDVSEDLYYRLNVMALIVPPLRERAEDIGGLAEFFRLEFMRLYRRETPPLSDALIGLLTGYHWPGNALELENLMKRYVVLGDEEQLTAELRSRSPLGAQRGRGRRGTPNTESLHEIGRRAAQKAEMAAILEVLERVQGNRAEAARLLKVSYKTLLNKLHRAGMPGRPAPRRFPPSGGQPAS